MKPPQPEPHHRPRLTGCRYLGLSGASYPAIVVWPPQSLLMPLNPNPQPLATPALDPPQLCQGPKILTCSPLLSLGPLHPMHSSVGPKKTHTEADCAPLSRGHDMGWADGERGTGQPVVSPALLPTPPSPSLFHVLALIQFLPLPPPSASSHGTAGLEIRSWPGAQALPVIKEPPAGPDPPALGVGGEERELLARGG